MYVYIQSEPAGNSGNGLWTVGFYTPDEWHKWVAESDHANREDAARRVHWLNGGDGAPR